MKKLEEQLKKRAQALRLTEAEKDSMRLALEAHMRLNPAKTAGSPWYRWYSMPAVRFAAPALAAVLLCTSTAYAAQGALPGDLLYPVKIHVNEPVEVALAATPAAKAGVEEHLAQERVTEAQTLAARGELTATTTQELQDNFDAHASEAIALAQEGQPHETQASSTSASTTPTATVALQTSLNTQAHILENLKLGFGPHATSTQDSEHATSTSSYLLDKPLVRENRHPRQSSTTTAPAVIISIPVVTRTTSTTTTTVEVEEVIPTSTVNHVIVPIGKIIPPPPIPSSLLHL